MIALKSALVALSIIAAAPAFAANIVFPPDFDFPTDVKTDTVTKNAGLGSITKNQ
ncbi:hypothetical protein C8N43_2484 [Litoreibacter ponti]|uniref:Uncharacterized protein n=1 Tax=Litoreibacter ponti TaxID=1510457 RepID=A0A2T6BP32_9RHOB|nr:hypothetical protein [Litoreibacter ponti]PTX57812.1 hypothetical protein C8N43_2484 [Litoreibacter ponti]